MELEGAVCLVTGATSGIGRATALRLAASAARVLAFGRDPSALQEVARLTSGVAVAVDLAEPAEVERAAREAQEAFGRVDVLVNNAGEGWAGRFDKQDAAAAERLVRVNLLAPIRLTRALLPGMLERHTGRVVNVSSVAGHVGVRDETVYASTKAGLIGFSESLRYELRGSGVAVSVVSPGVVRTPFFERRGASYARSFPRMIEPERVADAIIGAIQTGRAQVFVPRWLAFPVWLRGAWPGLYRALAGKYG